MNHHHQQQGRPRRRQRPAALLRSLVLALVVLLTAAVLASGGRAGLNGGGCGGASRRQGYGVVAPQPAAQPRQPVAWGETWEFEEDVLEPLRGLGTRILDFVLRRQPPEEPHPLRMQRWTITIRKFPFRRVVRHMQFYADGTCVVEEEIGGGPAKKRRPASQQQSAQTGGQANGGNKRRRNGKSKKTAAGGDGPALTRGTWRYDKYGLNFETDEGGVKWMWSGELIWHSFGDRPKMHCGVIVRNRGPNSLLPYWLFRPVVGTFHGMGNGTDTYITTQEGADSRFQNY